VTPEGRVKDVVKRFLRERGCATLAEPLHEPKGYYRMHVPNGYGTPALDFEGVYKGRFFAVEAKAFGNTPSAMQNLIMKAHANALGFSIWGDDAEAICARLGEFFDHVDTLV
jgi:hypothetical protein